MANRLLKRLKTDADLSGLLPPARYLLMVYAEVADSYTLKAVLSNTKLMKWTGLAERSIQRHREELIASGKLRLVRRGGGRHGQSIYSVLLGEEPTPEHLIPPAEKERLRQLGLLDSEDPSVTTS
jgi:hypothetical protein